jgi:hypothetical protein
MARFSGAVGYSEGQVEQAPGVWVEQIIEKSYFGDVLRSARRSHEGESLNNDLTVNNSISILADDYANEHIHAIKFVVLAGTAWDVDEVTVERPRLLLRLGGVYNGPRANPEEAPAP